MEEGLRMDAVRRTFHRAITMPVQNIEALWKEYDSFENNLNKMTVRFYPTGGGVLTQGA
jgi:cleavage stimulation factor subunit 3